MQPLPGEAEPAGQHRVRSIEQISRAWVPDRRHVHPDLVGPPGLQFDRDQAGAAECLERGLSMNIVRAGTSANCFRMAPPLTIAEDEIDLAVEILDASLGAVLADRPELAEVH